MRAWWIAGVVYGLMGIFAILLNEGPRGLRRPFDFRGSEPNTEPIKRAGFHIFLLIGIFALVVATIGSL